MLLRDLILKERLVALEARNESEEPKETIDARLHGLSIRDVDEGKTLGPITATNKQPEWQRNSYGVAFEEILMSSRAHRVVANDNSDAFSVISAAGITASWSMLSGLSLSEVSHIGIQAIPIYASDITNKEHYDFSPSAPHVIQIESRQPSSPEKLSRRDRLKGLFRGPRPLGPELLPDSDPEPPISIFGVALKESISHAHNLIIVTDEAGVKRIYGDIPLVIARAGRFLKENGNYGAKPSLYRYMLIEATYLGTSVEDTFATIGSPVRISKLQQAFESPPTYGSGLDWTQYTIHDAAGIFLRYLKSLPEPIIPYDCYGEFMDGLTPYIDRELTEEESAEAFKVARRLIGMMPSVNLELLAYVLDILSVFASRASYLDTAGLRLISIFQPSIISGPPNEMDTEAHRATSSVALMLLTHEEYIWGEMDG